MRQPQAIHSKVLGEDIWLLPDGMERPDQAPAGVVCYTQSEVLELQDLKPDQMQAVHRAKKLMEGDIVPRHQQSIVQIDDAGWGSLVGPVLIGGFRTDTNEFAYEVVPVECFQGAAYRERKYVEAGLDAFHRLRKSMDINAADTIELCQGALGRNHILSEIPGYLGDRGYRWSPVKIEGQLQTDIETAFLDVVLSLGVKTDLDTLTTKQGKFFHDCVQWLHFGNAYRNPKADSGREQHCKTGWPTYRLWADYPYRTARRLAKELRAQRSRERMQDIDR